jgi:hypothetical protein
VLMRSRRKKRCGNGGACGKHGKPTRVFHPSHSSLGISPAQRDSHTPTATAIVLSSPNQNQNPRKEVGRCAASASSFHDHSALESKTAFMIILGLENAVSPASVR